MIYAHIRFIGVILDHRQIAGAMLEYVVTVRNIAAVPALYVEITDDLDLVKFRKAAIRQGMKPLNLAGAQKVARGMTTIEEVLKVAPPRYDH